MSDRCRFWREQLSLSADGQLTTAQRAALENHLAECARCRAAREADQALRAVLRFHLSLNPARDPRAFDNSVIEALKRPKKSPLWEAIPASLRLLHQHWNALSSSFLLQVAGGTLAAVVITLFCVSAALQPTGKNAPTENLSGQTFSVRRGPPVPLESLLTSPSPRAAQLWTKPAGGKPETPAPPTGRQGPVAPGRDLDSPTRRTLPASERRSALDTPSNLG